MLGDLTARTRVVEEIEAFRWYTNSDQRIVDVGPAIVGWDSEQHAGLGVARCAAPRSSDERRR